MPSKSKAAQQPVIKAPAIPGALTRETLRAEHDLVFRHREAIDAALTKLAAGDGGKGVALYDTDFAQLCEMSPAQLGVRRGEYKDFWVISKGKNPKRIWHGTKEHADETRSMIGVKLS